VYHMPFWRAADGTLWEIEGSFARYVDSLAPYFDEVVLCVPLLDQARGEGTPIRSANVTLSPLPQFDGPAQFYPRLAQMIPRLASFVRRVDLVHYRVPTPAAVFVSIFARLFNRQEFLLVVGDLRALLPSMPYRGLKRVLWRAYTAFEERNVQRLADRALTFANGEALALKHSRKGRAVIQTQTTTIDAETVNSREDTCTASRIRILTVSRIDPRKGLRVLPEVVRLLVDRDVDATLDIIGAPVGAPGEEERLAIEDTARALGVANRVSLLGAIPLNQLLPRYRAYDVFALPTLPGEGIPRVLLEAMAAGLPVVTSRVSGIPSLVTHDANGLLVESPSAAAVAEAIGRLVRDGVLRRRIIAHGYAAARACTLEGQAARMMRDVSARLGLALRHSPNREFSNSPIR
jgi:glycosyltransferase involved in cell wall biosynthesis